ncbi:MAG: ImmA/IrrE family metallo-endopeptidase [Verrucomicrobia bacterium]|nr:ImmA/IrrE family metallo-endopeptidase [Verrucomicrobiota bacterium]
MVTLDKSYVSPVPTNWTQQSVQDFAETTAAKLGYQPGGDIEHVVRLLGGMVTDEHWDSPSATGYIEVRDSRDFTINLSPLASGTRRRFTTAHELGHYILHTHMGKLHPVRITREGSNRLEWEANWFAAGFLMPTAEFKRLVKEGRNDAELAFHFDVSMSAVEIRRTVLG